MGAWGAGTFENDAALDWLIELKRADSLQPVGELLQQVADLGPDDYLEIDSASAVLAAAAIVATLHDAHDNDLPPDARDWVAAHPLPVEPSLLELAALAVERVSENSELRELWAGDGPPDPEWWSTISRLLTRLAT
jgi:hypothetical protein